LTFVFFAKSKRRCRHIAKSIRKAFLIMSIISVLGALWTSCGKSSVEPHPYADVQGFLDGYSVNVNAVASSNGAGSSNKYQDFPLDLRGRYSLTSDRNGIVDINEDTGKVHSVEWTFQINGYENLEFSVWSIQRGSGGGLTPISEREKYVFDTDYQEKSQEFALAEFIASKADDPEFDGETWDKYRSREEFERSARYFLEYLDFMSNHELKLAILTFSFANPDLPSPSGRIVVEVGVHGGKLVPVTLSPEGRVYVEMDDFINTVLGWYDRRYE
jgi:hypothetical protein